MNDLTDALHLSGDVFQYASAPGRHLLNRLQPLTAWSNDRLHNEVEAYCKVTHGRIQPRTSAQDRGGRRITGVNFASQDYLSLASHPQIVAAAQHAAASRGVHSAGSAALMGLTDLTLELEREIASWLGYTDATVFPTGWGAGYGVIKALVRPTDHVVIDMLAHACLMEGAQAATPNVHAFAHLSARGLETRLARVRRDHPDAGIMVVTESLFSMDSDTPDLRHAVRVCRAHGATLVVDCAHDLGCMGTDGLGHLAAQGVLGEVDIVMGSFSKTFASNGGFVASSHPALKLALRYTCGPQTFTNAMSPIQAAVVLKALEIVRSDEGRERRVRLMDNINYLRSQLADCGFVTLGAPSPIVPTMLGDSALSRLICGETLRGGGLVNLVEYPAVSRNTSRLRLQVMADHSEADIDEFCAILRGAVPLAQAALELALRPVEAFAA
ncbi:aminotransferase class I/II-fold pyridoxal phosphate-dependent enzyme [Polaromonas sp.]|uniref:aminotransferase class I/II-fold pyridoxal phosphate-dependent enzyme n=1 Tax=Polaromonas sp. TaxID=1869339 RepID=UPI003752212F